MPISLYSCANCKRQFKTNQHLEQHKNRKKSCAMVITNEHLNEVVVLPKETTTNISLYDIKLTDILNFVKTAQSIQELMKDKELIEEYKLKITQLENEKKDIQDQLDTIKTIINNTKTNNQQNLCDNYAHEINNL